MCDRITVGQSPRQLYHGRQVAMLMGFCVLAFFCVADLALAVNYSNAATRYEDLSGFGFAAVMATIAA